MRRSVKTDMPGVFAWLESLREVFGREEMNKQIALGMEGKATLYLFEGDIEIGTPAPEGVPAAIDYVKERNDRRRDRT